MKPSDRKLQVLNLRMLLGAAAVAWPLAARAQQPAVPVIGYLYAGSSEPVADLIAVFRHGLAENGYIESQNVMIEYRFAGGRYDRLPDLATDLVRRQVAAIVTPPSTAAALAAKAATQTIPIVFAVTDDPAKLGLVASLSRPGGNATGVNFLVAELVAKRLALLHELAPAATRVVGLVNPNNANTESVVRDLTQAALALGMRLDVLHARDSHEIEAAFAALVGMKVDALLVGPDSVFQNRRVQLATLAARHAVPAVFPVREFVEVGGLISYGTSLKNVYFQLAVYTGRILKGVMPGELPVVQSTKFELVINLPTARAIGLEIPPTLLARADEVIE
jgi:putative ABC transport system substrate-binding protein